MPGKVIGKTLPFGFAGTVSRMSDCVIAPYKYDIAHISDGNINFGEVVAYDTTNGGIRKLDSNDDDNSVIIGIAVRRMGQPKADNANGWYYEPGETVDVLLRGSIAVELEATTGLAARGNLYVDPATGKLYAATDTGRLAVANSAFANGKVDEANVTEVTLVERVI